MNSTCRIRYGAYDAVQTFSLLGRITPRHTPSHVSTILQPWLPNAYLLVTIPQTTMLICVFVLTDFLDTGLLYLNINWTTCLNALVKFRWPLYRQLLLVYFKFSG